MDSIILVSGKAEGNDMTVAIVGWFFAGYNLANTIIALTPKSIIIYASDHKGNPYTYTVTFLSKLKEDDAAKKHNLSFMIKNEDPEGSFRTLWTELHGSNPNPKVGMIIKDAKTGQIAEEFMKFL